jgi:hypothetical protein
MKMMKDRHQDTNAVVAAVAVAGDGYYGRS